jgi:excisionase family DNA binding protein
MDTIPNDAASLWTASKAAEYLNVHVDTVYDLAAAGKLPACKIGRRWLFVPALLAEHVRSKCLSSDGAPKRTGAVPASLAQRIAAHRVQGRRAR